MATNTTSPDGDMETGADPYSQLTISAFGPIVYEQIRGEITLAVPTQAQVERPVRDADDFTTITADHDTGKAIDAVRHMVYDVDGVRLPKGMHDQADYAHGWERTIEGPVSAWLELAEEESDPRGLANGNDPLDVLEHLARRSTVGPNALLAGMSLAADQDDDQTHEELLEAYQERFEDDDQ